ncbi:MAG: EAL domain-containing protein [Solirubrobacterales bacterium]|nr:EAL domain-containing protein [Solirubrobacterales bacterium]
MAHLDHVVGERRRFTVLYVDLDDFKLVNDTLGHSAGDDLLRHVAAAMRTLVGPEDLLARQGGDEFVLIAMDPPDADRLAERLLSAITQPVSLRGLTVRVGASIGVACCPNDGSDASALIENADAAMYDAKGSGRNQIRRGRPLHTRDRDRDRAALELTATLPQAVAHDELVLPWQPLVDVADLSIVGLEALVRWNHPERGLLYPGAFIPFAERTGMITAIDAWVASAVTRQRHAWHTQGLDPYVGFNLAPQYARHPDALESLLVRLSHGGLGLDHITVELTESEALREDRRLLEFAHGLHKAGITVSLDDFGRAYSSLNRLREVPARWIKLDRAFLEGVPENDVATEVLTAIIDLLRALRYDFIIEGVEREPQRQLLSRLGVRVAQGFLLGRPVPADDLHDRLRQSPVCHRTPSPETTDDQTDRPDHAHQAVPALAS